MQNILFDRTCHPHLQHQGPKDLCLSATSITFKKLIKTAGPLTRVFACLFLNFSLFHFQSMGLGLSNVIGYLLSRSQTEISALNRLGYFGWLLALAVFIYSTVQNF